MVSNRKVDPLRDRGSDRLPAVVVYVRATSGDGDDSALVGADFQSGPRLRGVDHRHRVSKTQPILLEHRADIVRAGAGETAPGSHRRAEPPEVGVKGGAEQPTRQRAHMGDTTVDVKKVRPLALKPVLLSRIKGGCGLPAVAREHRAF